MQKTSERINSVTLVVLWFGNLFGIVETACCLGLIKNSFKGEHALGRDSIFVGYSMRSVFCQLADFDNQTFVKYSFQREHAFHVLTFGKRLKTPLCLHFEVVLVQFRIN